MTEMLSIQGGHNNLDPLRDYFQHASLPTEQDPYVQERCIEVWRSTLDLCLRIPDVPQTHTKDDSVLVQTPPFMYDGQPTRPGVDSSSGIMIARANIPFFRLLGAIRTEEIDVELCVPSGFEGGFEPVTTVQRDNIWLNTPAGRRAGGHSDLNFMWNVVTKMREAAFPKTDRK